MIAADTSSLIAYFGGDQGRDVESIEAAMEGGTLHLPPVVVTELLSDFKSRSIIEASIIDRPR